MTKKVDQSTRIIKQQQATIEQLQAKLSGKSFVSHEHYAALQLERDQLAARVGELEQLIRDMLCNSSVQTGQPFLCEQAEAALNRSKPSSLARHDAALRRELADAIEREGFEIVLNVVGWLNYEADRIEQEAAK